jgi:hypothetical protein
MDCLNGHGPMLRGQNSWVCEVCGERRPQSGRVSKGS